MPHVNAFRLFKYAVYALLLVNVGYFFVESFGAALYTERDGLTWREVIVAFATPIDTAAWLVLLVMLELETAVIDDDALRGRLAWTVGVATALCYAIIVYAFFGYYGVREIPMGFAAYAGPDPCSLVGGEASFAFDYDEYAPLDAENCRALAAGAVYNPALDMFATPAVLDRIARLVWLDIINAGTWLIVVTSIAAEIFLTAQQRFPRGFFRGFKILNFTLYAVLIVAALDWARLGKPWDAWDAFLWLAAFFFIELNILDWQEETSAAANSPAPGAG